jgi:cell division protease FtsH
MGEEHQNKQDQQGGDGSKRGQGPGGGPGGGPTAPKLGRGAGWLALAAVLLVLMVVFRTVGPPSEKVTWAEFKSMYQGGEITEVVIEQNAVSGKMIADAIDDQEKRVAVDSNPMSREWLVAEVDTLTGGDFTEIPGPGILLQILSSGVIYLLIFFVIIFIFMRSLRGAGGGGGMLGSFGKSRHKVMAKESSGITFDDVAGVDEAKEEVQEIVEFLKHPKKFMRLGGRVPRGVLLVGSPGCGKTLLAKAIAGEADVPFFSISGSDFVEMFVGVGASRVRDLFKQAKESSPCIIFLDEIDAVGRRRGGGFSSGGHDEREQTLNAILVEMDGFESSDQVIVIAATNRSDVLDPALTRPGRFDRQVVVGLPDVKGRLEILRVHSKKVKLGPDVDLEKIARGTPMLSGAELEAVINEAAIGATLADKDFVEHEDLEEARDKVRYGRTRKSRKIEEEERIATAYHEAGHAVLQMLVDHADPLHKVTIIPRGQSLGATFSLPEKDRYGYGLKWINATMRVVCGGRIAEQRKTGDISSGASQDIRQLTSLARHMVLEWGMSERLGFVRYAGTDSEEAYVPEREYSDETAQIIDEEIRRYSKEAYDDADRALTENWEKVSAIAEALLKHETLSSDEVASLMRGEQLDKPSVGDLLAAEAAKLPPTPPPAPETPAAEDERGDELGPGVMPTPA